MPLADHVGKIRQEKEVPALGIQPGGLRKKMDRSSGIMPA
jgi:hypothetical protein